MKQSIKILKQRIDILHLKIDEHQKFVDEPEMNCELVFAQNDIANWELEVIELQKACEILIKHIK